MAELQWVVEVRCVNALLAQIKVGETGEHFIVEAPADDFDPSEFEKLIEGVKSAITLGNEQYAKLKKKSQIAKETNQPPHDVKIVDKRELYSIQLLSSGELALVTVKKAFFAPSELNRFLLDLEKAKQQMAKLRNCKCPR
jgi:hypothetical protein